MTDTITSGISLFARHEEMKEAINERAKAAREVMIEEAKDGIVKFLIDGTAESLDAFMSQWLERARAVDHGEALELADLVERIKAEVTAISMGERRHYWFAMKMAQQGFTVIELKGMK
jgi:hypothetical protein